MNIFFKYLTSFFLISLLSTLIFIWYIKQMKYPGGAVGMAPLVIMFGSFLSTIISMICLVFMNLILKVKPSINQANLIFTFFYILIAILFFGVNPFLSYEDQISQNINIWYILSQLISLSIMFIFYSIMRKMIGQKSNV